MENRQQRKRSTLSAVRLLVPLCAAVAVLLSAPSSQALPLADGFVTASGTELELDGRPWYLYGASTYGTSNPGGSQSIATEIALATDGRLNTLRIVDMFDASGADPGGPYSESAWAHIDDLLAEIEAAGLHAILDLSAFRNFLQNRELYLRGVVATGAGYPIPAECVGRTGDDLSRCVGARWCVENAASCTNPYSTDQAAAWDSFLEFVATRVNTETGVEYRSDTTIAIVAFAGEPNPPNSGEPLKPTTQELTDFYERVFGQWKAYDPNHLVTTGGLLHIDWEELYGGSSGIDHLAIFSLPNQDVLSIHNYFGRFPATPGNDTKTEVIAMAAEDVGKPWITEEFGFLQAPVDSSTTPATTYSEADRGDWFRSVYETQLDPPAGVPSAGVAFWNLGSEVAAQSHDVNPQTPETWAAVLEFAPGGLDPLGQVTEFTEGISPGSGPYGITAGPGGKLWFTEAGTDKIASIEPVTGDVVEYPSGITADGFLSFIAAGPDGSLWYADGLDRILKLDPDTGAVTSYSAGISPVSGPTGVAFGPDGNLWFASFQGRVGKLDPNSGLVTEYPVDCQALAIAAGPESKMWFTCPYSDRVSSIDPASGAITPYTAGISPGSGPWGIASGADGGIWFTEAYGHRIARLDPVTGSVTEYSDGITGSGTQTPYVIALGPDGALWFTEPESALIGRLDPATGDVTEYSDGITAAFGSPYMIAAGPDGNMWFTGYDSNRVGKIGVGTVTPPPPDGDGDGVADSVDNCPTVANADQADADADSLGDACDPDANGDGIADLLQPSGTPAGSFSNVVQGKASLTTGTVTAGTVAIDDLADPTKGVRITAITDAVVSVCADGFEFEIAAGTSATVTCGSVTVEQVVGGSVTVSLPGSETSVIFGEDSSGTVNTQPGGGVTVDDASGQVTMLVGTLEAPVPPGDSTLIKRGDGNDSITGTAGNDVIFDTGGNNTINGRGGQDTIVSGPGNDTIDGGDGNDWIDAGDGKNLVKGGTGADQIRTGAGNDTIDGGPGTDVCDAGAGKNNVKNCP